MSAAYVFVENQIPCVPRNRQRQHQKRPHQHCFNSRAAAPNQYRRSCKGQQSENQEVSLRK